MEFLIPFYKNLPKSTKQKYILDPHLTDIFCRKAQLTRNFHRERISQEDIDELLIGINYHAGKYLLAAKVVLFCMYFSLWTIIPYLIYLGVTNSDSDKKYNAFIFVFSMIGLWIFELTLYLTLCSAAEKKVRAYFVKVNNIKYANKGAHWKIGRFLRYFELHSKPTNESGEKEIEIEIPNSKLTYEPLTDVGSESVEEH